MRELYDIGEQCTNLAGVHAPGLQEHTLCGFAPEAFESGDADTPIVFAVPGQTVTCPTCCQLIEHCREAFRRNGDRFTLKKPKGTTP